MDTPAIEGSSVLPDIDKQIQYIKHLRKDVIPRIKDLQTELDMISAIEQSLLAAKMLVRSRDLEIKSSLIISNLRANQFLSESKIKLTATRVEVLKAILFKKDNEFTISEIHKAISENMPISRSAVISSMLLFKKKGLVEEGRIQKNWQKKTGRPETTFRYKK